MKHKFLFIITILLFGVTVGCFAQINSNSNEKKVVEKPIYISKEKEIKVKNKENLKVLAKGNYSGVETPFIHIAKDSGSLKKAMELANIDELNEKVSFEKNLVITAFAGGFRTGGYSVSINESDGKVFVKLNKPPKGAMVTQALTQPYKMVLVQKNKNNTIKLEVGNPWKSSAKKYEVKSGTFEYSGGIAGVYKKFEPKGTLEVYKLGSFVTIILDLYAKEKESDRKLYEIVSTNLQDKKVLAEKVDSGNFITSPHPDMKITALFDEEKVIFDLVAEDEKFPVNDRFEGKGTLEAIKTD